MDSPPTNQPHQSNPPAATVSLTAQTKPELGLPSKLGRALRDLAQGRPVLLFDAEGREGETDLVFWAEKATPEAVRQLRREAGGLIFLMCPHPVAEALGLPFLQDLWAELGRGRPLFEALAPHDIPYDSRSSFSLTINHRGTYTGITDNDRALTIATFAKLARQVDELAARSREAAIEAFGAAFRSPGHVPLCVAEAEPLSRRYGHTELGVALLMLGGLNPVGVGAEMLADDGGALPPSEAARIARERGLTFLTGAEIVAAWRAQTHQP